MKLNYSYDAMDADTFLAFVCALCVGVYTSSDPCGIAHANRAVSAGIIFA